MSTESESMRSAAAALLTEKRDSLVAERAILMEQRAELLSRLRRVDREISDCRAAARVFQIDLEFPSLDDRDDVDYVRRRELEWRREVEERNRRLAMAPHRAHQTVTFTSRSDHDANQKPQALEAHAHETVRVESRAEAEVVSAASKPRPSVREIVLGQMKAAGESGVKASPLREHIERTYGEIIHDKTVGMTLYRLSKAGLARRDGHTWFFVPPTAETENPGADTPGSESLLD